MGLHAFPTNTVLKFISSLSYLYLLEAKQPHFPADMVLFFSVEKKNGSRTDSGDLSTPAWKGRREEK
jgi:hypothetical protein